MIKSLFAISLALACPLLWAGTPTNQHQFQLDAQTRVNTWDETDSRGTRSFYRIVENGQAFTAEADYTVHLRHGSFNPADGVPAPLFESLASGSQQNLYIVQFVTQILPGYIKGIEAQGAVSRFFLPNYAQIALMTPETAAKLRQLPYVRWVGPFHPAYRLEEYYLANADIAERAYPLQKYNIMTFDSGLREKTNLADRIRKLGGQVDRADAGKFLLEATLTYDQLFQVVGWDEVLFIDHWSPGEADMDIARVIGGANFLEGVEGFTGQGVRGEVIDLGFNLAHVDFASRPLIQHTTVNSDSHGAACSGIVFGDGTGNPAGRGMLPDGQGIVADWDVVNVGQPRYTHTGELAQAPYFAVFQTASVGSDRTTEYTTLSADTDAALFDFDVLHCQSQSNAGDRMSRPQAWAKNVLSGGAVNHQNTLSRTDDCWCGGASIGPATDGRIKPDLASFYDDIMTTTTGSPTSYTTGFGGTSGATPIICGHAGLVFQMWADGIFGNFVDPDGSVFENRCHMTTAKALLINTAYRYDFSGANHDLTRVHQGWGMPDLQRLYEARDNMIVIDEADVIQPLATNSYTAHVQDGTPTLNVTMIFADPPGNPASTVHRINNLNLRVTSPSGDVYWGNNGLTVGNWSTEGGSPNDVDTVECVFIQNPEVGAWTVDVIAAEINQDSHVETPQLDADYALVVTGAIAGPGFSLVTPEPSLEVCGPASINFPLEITQQLGFSESVTLSASGATGGSVTFSSNPIVPPTTVTVTLHSAGMAAGDYLLNISGDATAISKELFLAVKVNTSQPADPTNLYPGNGTSDIATRPTFTWDAASQANSYSFELASDPDFNSLIASEELTETSFALTSSLSSLTCYYWRVRANNSCGVSAWQAAGFTTQEQPDYFSQLFTAGSDLGNTRLRFVPDGSGDYYSVCRDTIAQLPTSPSGGTTLALSDDSSLPLSATVNFYGTTYNTIHVGSNGYVTFLGGDNSNGESYTAHFTVPRVALVYDDLNPPNGSVTYRQLGDRLAISWVNVPKFQTTNINTFQVEFFNNGQIHLSWLTVQTPDSLAGLSNGGGIPSDFIASDLSGYGLCGSRPEPRLGGCSLQLCEGDLNTDGSVDQIDLSLLLESWPSTTSVGDLNTNGHIDLLDMLELLELFGECP